MIEQILKRKNLLKAVRQVEKNKGSSGVDRMPVSQLSDHLGQTRDSLLTSILSANYVAQPILGVEIPKGEGKTRLLGVPTVIDRMLQQAASHVIAPKFELEFNRP
jgi:RNA-directed DNA polymerase